MRTGFDRQHGPVPGTLATKVINKNADAVFYAGYYCDLALMAKALRNKGFTGTIMSGDGSKDENYIKQATAKVAEGTLLSCQCSEITKIQEQRSSSRTTPRTLALHRAPTRRKRST